MKINLDSVSHKQIMFLVYMRTLLELCVNYDENGNLKEHTLTVTAYQLYNRIRDIETAIYNKSKKLKDKYLEAHELSKPVWAKSLEAMGNEYQIYIEPIVATLYSSMEKELKQIGLLPVLPMRMYDQYFEKYKCELEVESVKPVDVIIKETEKALFEFKKQKKRGSNECI